MDFHLQRLQNVISDLTSSMTPEDLARHPAGKWCAAEIMEHLYLSYTGTVKAFERCLRMGKPVVSQPTLKQRVAVALVVGLGYMPEGRKAPKVTLPRGTAPHKVLTEILAQIAAMDDVIQRCESRYGQHAHLVDHPVLGPLTGQQWRKFHWVHSQHHVKQILRLKGKPETETRRAAAGL